MSRLEQLQALNGVLLTEMPEYRAQGERFPREEGAQRRLLRSLMNLRPPMPLDPDLLAAQDALLSAETAEKGVVDGETLVPTQADPRLVLWQGDITRLRADAIVNAANSALLGCFHPCHGCIDNAIHSAAGLQLRDECFRLMEAQGHPEPNGRAKLTGGYNLPARHVLHTVGPIVRGRVTQRDRRSWPPATAPAWSWRRSAACTACPSAVSPPGSSTSPTGRPPRLRWTLSRSASGKRLPSEG